MTIAPSVRATVNDDGAVLIDVGQGTIFSLNGLGATIWTAVERGASREDVLAQLADTFPEIPDADLARDFDEFLSELIRQRLVRA